MLMKCTYNEMFLPIVKAKLNEFTNEEDFKKFLTDSFENGEELYARFVTNPEEGLSVDTTPEVLPQVQVKLNTADNTPISDIFFGEPSRAQNLTRAFSNKMIESCFFSKGDFIVKDPSAIIDGISNLNRDILTYKLELLNNIRKYLGIPNIKTIKDFKLNDDNITAELTEYRDETLSLFNNRINDDTNEQNASFNAAYDNYILFSKFDNLLKEKISYISINKEYKNETDFYINKYSYNPKTLTHYSNFGSEHANALGQVSDIAEQLLDYFPDVNDENEDIENTSITTTGFLSVMTKLVRIINNNKDAGEIFVGIKLNAATNFNELIYTYLANKNEFTANEVILLLNKLRGIAKYAFNTKTPEHIKNMFAHMATKFVPTNYIAYQFNEGMIKMRELTEQFITNERFVLLDTLWGAHTNLKQLSSEDFKSRLEANGIKIEGNIIKIKDGDHYYELKYDIKTNPSSYSFTFDKDFNRGEGLSNETLDKISQAFLNLQVALNASEIGKSIKQTDVNFHTNTNLYLPLIATVLLSVNSDAVIKKEATSNPFRVQGSNLYNLASVLSIVNGSSVKNVVKNLNGDNIPLYQLTSLAAKYHEIIDKVKDVNDKSFGTAVVGHNYIFKNKKIYGGEYIRESIEVNKTVKPASKLLPNELFHLSIIQDFYQNLVNSGDILLQTTTYADKSRHYLIKYKTGTVKIGDKYLKDLLIDISKGDKLNSQKALKAVKDAMFNARKNQYEQLRDNILSDFRTAFPDKSFNNLDDLNEFLAKEKVGDLQKAFSKKNIILRPELHYTKYGKRLVVNETIKNLVETYSSDNNKLADQRYNDAKRNYLKALLDSEFTLTNTRADVRDAFKDAKGWTNSRTDLIILGKIKNSDGNWINITQNSIISDDAEIELNPVLEAYFIADGFLSNEYNNLMTGYTFMHTNKNKTGEYGKKEYAEKSEANRLIAQYKRQVIYGATYHSYAQGLKSGVTENINVAVIDDITANVFNQFGVGGSIDTMDGSGFSSVYQAMMERISLLDAAAGIDSKTIFHDIDPMTGSVSLLKWACFAITNELRRLGYGSNASVEKIFKKMHSQELKFKPGFALESYYNTLGKQIYYRDPLSGKTYKIVSVESRFVDGKLQGIKTIEAVDKNGNPVGIEPESVTLELNTIYDLDTFFGGAFTKELENGELVNSELNTHVTFNIIVDQDFRDKMTHFIVNKSAIKVGAANINSSDVWEDDNPLTSFPFSTKFGGIQMNAEHDLEDSETTEMTQMISALAQSGFTNDLTLEVYKKIADVVDITMNDWDTAIALNDRDEVYKILADAMINSFREGEKDTLGLAQAFVALANKSLKEGKFDYTIPFSAASINGAFTSTITSTITKKAIRRHYSGPTSYLKPSHNTIMYYNINGNNYKFEDLYKIVNDAGVKSADDRSAVEIALNDFIINGKRNPFIININKNDIDFEDTIVYKNDKGDLTALKIDTIAEYEFIKSLNTELYKWTIKPKNLKQSNTIFYVNINGVDTRFSIYDTDEVRLSYLLTSEVEAAKENNKKLKYSELSDTAKYLYISIYGDGNLNKEIKIDEFTKDIKKRIQNTLNDLAEGKPIRVSERFKSKDNVTSIIPLNVEVIPADVVLGKAYANQFGLSSNDNLSDILNKGYLFFFNKMAGKFTVTNTDENSFDLTLFTNDKEVYVKHVDDYTELKKGFEEIKDEYGDFKIVGNNIYYDGNKIADTIQKKLYKYTKNDKEHVVIVITDLARINEITKNNEFVSYKYNYTLDNYEKILKFRNINTNYKFKTSDTNSNQFERFDNLDESDINILNLSETFKLLSRQEKFAKNKFNSFKKSLDFIGARIPSQTMQTTMPLRVVMFTENNINEVYVPKAQTWLQGSDYDIDKLFIMGYTFDKFGRLVTSSNLSNKYDISEVLKLPYSNGKTYKVSDSTEDAYVVSYDDFYDYYNNKNLDIFKKIMNSNYTNIYFEGSISEDKYKYAMEDFIKDLNSHNQSKPEGIYAEDASKNLVVSSIFNGILDPRNQINMHIPISMDVQKDAAKIAAKTRKDATGKEDFETIINSDNPAAKGIMQDKNMVGREVIGITAVSLKVFLMLTSVYNKMANDAVTLFEAGNIQEGVNLLEKLVFKDPLDGSSTSLANINLNRLIKFAETKPVLNYDVAGYEHLSKFQWSGQFNLKGFLEYLKNRSDVEDAAGVISGLLSAATDNAKELLLSKLNATSEFVDIYTYLIGSSIEFNNITELMTSTLFDEVVKIAKPNIFDPVTKSFRLKNAINFMLGDDILPIINKDRFIDYFKFYKIEDLFALYDTKNDKELKELNEVEKLLLGGIKYDKKTTLYQIFNEISGGGVEFDSINITLANNNNVTALLYLISKQINKHKSNERAKYLASIHPDGHDGYDEGQLYYDEDQSGYDEGQLGYDDIDLADLDEMEMGGSRKKDRVATELSQTELINLQRLLREFEFRNDKLTKIKSEDLEKQKVLLQNLRNNIIPGAEEMSILGKMLGINQGIKTNTFDKYKWIAGVEEFFNTKIIKENIKLEIKKKDVIFETFDLIKFISDPEYQERQIQQYDNFKIRTNILENLVNSPHFNAMLKSLYTDDKLISNSAKNKLTKDLSVQLFSKENSKTRPDKAIDYSVTKKLHSIEFKEITKYVDDIFIFNWLRNTNLKFKVKDKQQYFKNAEFLLQTSKGETELDLSTTHGITSFKYIMDTYVLPELKAKHPNNYFLQNITFSTTIRKGVQISNWRPTIDMMQTDSSEQTKSNYGRILTAFNDLGHSSYNGWSVMNLLYLYNLIVNKDTFGQKTFTKLFEDVYKTDAVKNSNNSLIHSYYTYIAQLDRNPELRNNIEYNLDDLRTRIVNLGLTNSEYITGIFEIQPTSRDIKNSINISSVFPLNLPVTLYSHWIHTNNVEPIKGMNDSQTNVSFSVHRVFEALKPMFKENAFIGNTDELTKELKKLDIDDKTITDLLKSDGFVLNGKIYINSDNADKMTPIHELSHVIMAGLKMNNSDLYYNLLSKLDQNTAEYKSISEMPEYKNRHFSDLREEIFIKLMSDRFKNRWTEVVNGKEFNDSDESIKQILSEIFKLDSDLSGKKLTDITSLKLNDVFIWFGSEYLSDPTKEVIGWNHIHMSQQLADWKDLLIKMEVIEEDCAPF